MLVVHPYDVALTLRARRLHLKLTQAEVARAAGVGRQWIVACEGGKGTVAFATVMRVLEALDIGVSLDFTRLPPPAWTLPLTEAAKHRRALADLRHVARTGRMPGERPSRRKARPPPAGWSEGR